MIDSEGLHKVREGDGDSSTTIADIVFVHGLGGSSHATWRYSTPAKSDHFFWPYELALDFPHCAVWTVGYPAGLGAMGAAGMIIEKRAGNLAQKLANAGLGDRPIMFVTHSMGGLVVKALLVGSGVQADRDRKKIARQTAGIVFCATPHRGSDYAKAATILGAFLGGTQDHVKEMQAGKESLDILHDQFVEWQRIHCVPICSYAENIGLFRQKRFFRIIPIQMVVPRDSANPNIAGHTVRDVDEDHLSIVKPKSRVSDVYAGVFRFLAECLEARQSSNSVFDRVKTESSIEIPVDVALAALAQLTHTQKKLVRIVSARESGGIGVTDLAKKLGLERSETVYRVRDLKAQGLLKAEQLTDLWVELGSGVLSLKNTMPEEFYGIFDECT
jgi:pimeloyl-ACP methyl ester carboxylesterase